MEMQRLRWACRRGMLELDLVLLPFVENVYSTLPESDKLLFDSLLDCEDTELFNWFLEKGKPESSSEPSLGPRPASDITAVATSSAKASEPFFNIGIMPSNSVYLYVIWFGCFLLAAIYAIYFSLGWIGLALWALCFALFLRINRWVAGLSHLGYDGDLFVVVHGRKIRVTSCKDIRVFPYCVLAIAKLEAHSDTLIDRVFCRSIALNLNRKNLSEDDLHLVRRYFSKF